MDIKLQALNRCSLSRSHLVDCFNKLSVGIRYSKYYQIRDFRWTTRFSDTPVIFYTSCTSSPAHRFSIMSARFTVNGKSVESQVGGAPKAHGEKLCFIWSNRWTTSCVTIVRNPLPHDIFLIRKSMRRVQREKCHNHTVKTVKKFFFF